MSEDEIEELEKQIGKKRLKKEPNEVIEIRHTKVESDNQSDLQTQLESEKQRREELELIVEAEATKTFMTDRDNLLKKIPESRREKVEEYISDDPEKLQLVKTSLLLQGQTDFDDEDEEDERTPSGRARLPDSMLPPSQRGQSRNQMYDNNPTIAKYSDLYAIIRDPKSTVEQKQEAEQILDETFAEIRKGLRNRSKSNPYQLPTGVVNHCMRCGYVTEIDLSKGTPCPACGYRFGIDDFPRNPKFQPR